jgi:hypothetical protein
VNQPGGVGRRQALRRLAGDLQAQAERQRGPRLQRLRQRSAAQHLHDQVGQVALLIDVVNGDDVVAADVGPRPRLAQEALPAFGVGGQLRPHHLQGHRPLKPCVVGQKDQPHAALAEQAQHAVVPQPAQLVRSLRRGQEPQGRRLGTAGLGLRLA